jgi:SAM-dependent methyltransferase
MEPANFYTGIVAELYEPLKSTTQNPEPYAQFVEESGEPALELGCGDGEPLLDLRRRGLDVEGVDSSADMLDRCRRRAADARLDVVVHHQRMEALDLPRRYRSIFLAGPTFILLPDDDTGLRALRGIRAHLDEGGTALVPLFIPSPTPALEFGRAREALAADGATLRASVLTEHRDEPERTQRTTLRYERHADGESSVVDRPWTLHWHTPEGFRDLATAAGLITTAIRDHAGQPAPDDATEFTFLLRPAP